MNTRGAGLARTLAHTGTWTTGKTDPLEVLSRKKSTNPLSPLSNSPVELQ
jgi:hypothetical protein